MLLFAPKSAHVSLLAVSERHAGDRAAGAGVGRPGGSAAAGPGVRGPAGQPADLLRPGAEGRPRPGAEDRRLAVQTGPPAVLEGETKWSIIPVGDTNRPRGYEGLAVTVVSWVMLGICSGE